MATSSPQFEQLTAPPSGTAIRFESGQPVVPNDPIIPFIRGDGTGVDIWPATQKVLDAAVAQAYGGERRIEWFKVYAGDEACDLYGTYQYLPEDTLEAIRTYGVAIKGPLTTPIGGRPRLLGALIRGLTYESERWRLATLGDWQPSGSHLPDPAVVAKLQTFCRGLFDLLSGAGSDASAA